MDLMNTSVLSSFLGFGFPLFIHSSFISFLNVLSLFFRDRIANGSGPGRADTNSKIALELRELAIGSRGACSWAERALDLAAYVCIYAKQDRRARTISRMRSTLSTSTSTSS